MRKVGRAANRLGDEEKRGKMPDRAMVELCFKAQARVHWTKRSKVTWKERSRHKAETWGAGCVRGV